MSIRLYFALIFSKNNDSILAEYFYVTFHSRIVCKEIFLRAAPTHVNFEKSHSHYSPFLFFSCPKKILCYCHFRDTSERSSSIFIAYLWNGMACQLDLGGIFFLLNGVQRNFLIFLSSSCKTPTNAYFGKSPKTFFG